MKLRSIRTYLVLAVAATLVLLMFVALLKGYSASTKKAEHLFDTQLHHLAELIAMANRDEVAQENFAPPIKDEAAFFQIWSEHGTLIAASKNAPETQEPALIAGYSDANLSHYRWRILSYWDAPLSRWVVVGERRDIRLVFADTMVLESLLPMILGILFSALLIWFLVGRGLRPLHDLANTLSKKQSADLSPISLANMPKELTPLVASINGLFERLSDAFHRERQFSANAAHELRTPIAALKLHAENIQASLAAGDPEAALLVEGAERMGYVIEQILSLHRTVPDQAALAFEPVDLAQLARMEIAGHYEQFDLKHQHVTLLGDSGMMQGNDFALRTLLQNLLSNACKYTPNGGDIQVSVEMMSAGVRLIVADSGVGIPSVKHSEVFKRFYRLDSDQHASGTLGCGLGLAIVQHIVTLHQAEISLSDSNVQTGLKVTIDFPALKVISVGENNAV